MAGRMINGAAALAELVRPAGDTAEPGVHRVLPVVPELSGLLPGRGLRRGSTVAVATGQSAPGQSAPGSGGTSLLLALLSAASRSGSWCAVVGVPALGVLAAAESGIALDRLALVPNPGPEWPTVVAALIDGVDVVVTAVPGPVSASIATRLAARARQRGSVLMPFGRWDGADVTLQVTNGRWEGLTPGRGRLRRRMVTVLARGRGAAARPRESTMWMPGLTTTTPPRATTTTPLPAATTSPPPAAVITPFPAAATASDPAVGSAGVTPGPGSATLPAVPVGSDPGAVAQDRVDAVVRAGVAVAGGVASESLVSAPRGQAVPASLTTFPADFEPVGDPAGGAFTGSGGELPATAFRRNRPTPGALVSGPVPATAAGRFRGVRANSRFGLA